MPGLVTSAIVVIQEQPLLMFFTISVLCIKLHLFQRTSSFLYKTPVLLTFPLFGFLWLNMSTCFPACPSNCQQCTVNAAGTAECDTDKCDPGYGLKADKTCLG